MICVVLRCSYFQVMKHAGLAITITTVTDLVTFVISNFTTKFLLVRSQRHIVLQFLQKHSKVELYSRFCKYTFAGSFASLPFLA